MPSSAAAQGGEQLNLAFGTFEVVLSGTALAGETGWPDPTNERKRGIGGSGSLGYSLVRSEKLVSAHAENPRML